MANEGTILLAEDDANHVLLFSRAFKKAGFANPLRVVVDGEEAIDYLKGQGKYADREQFPAPQILVLDLKMPRVGGLEVIHWVRQQPAMKHLPIIVLTTSSQDWEITLAYRAGANSFLVKAMDVERFIQQIKELGEYWLTGQSEVPSVPPAEPPGSEARDPGSAGEGVKH